MPLQAHFVYLDKEEINNIFWTSEDNLLAEKLKEQEYTKFPNVRYSGFLTLV
jgi:hypothetical protein